MEFSRSSSKKLFRFSYCIFCLQGSNFVEVATEDLSNFPPYLFAAETIKMWVKERDVLSKGGNELLLGKI